MATTTSTTDDLKQRRLDCLHAGRRHEDLTPYKAALAEVKIRAYVEKILAEAPTLSAEARDRLASLLGGD